MKTFIKHPYPALLLALFLGTLLFPALSNAATIDLQASVSADATIYSSSPDSNQNSWGIIVHNSTDDRWRSLLKFDISSIPSGATIETATLSLYYSVYTYRAPAGLTVWAYKQTHPNWVENEVSWNSYKSGSGWSSAGGDFVTSNPAGASATFPVSYGWMDWTITDIVADAYSNAVSVELLMKYENETANTPFTSMGYWASSENADTTLRPKLHVEYTLAADTAPPVRSNGSPAGTLSAGTTQASLSLTTNENAVCKYSTAGATNYDSMPNTFSVTGALSHSTLVSGLNNGSSYTYYIKCADSAGNKNTDDFLISFSIASPETPGWPGWSSISTVYYDPSQEEPLNAYLQQAAIELRDELAKLGKTLTVTNAKPASGSIYLEVNSYHPDLINRGKEAFKLYTTTNGIYITGKTALAVRNGAYVLLDKLGFRWYFKSPIWTVVPNSLQNLGVINEVQEPSLFGRHILHAWDYGSADTKIWAQRNLEVPGRSYTAIHNYSGIIPRQDYLGAEPISSYPGEALFTGEPNVSYWQIDGYNPEVVQKAIDYARTQLAKPPSSNLYTNDVVFPGAVSVSPNDGGGWYPPYTTAQQKTDVSTYLANEVAKIVAVEYPDRYASVLNYFQEANIPSSASHPNKAGLSPNLLVIVVGPSNFSDPYLTTDQRITGIKATGAAVGYYSWLDVVAYNSDRPDDGFNRINQIAGLVSQGVEAYQGEAADGWASFGLTYYLTARLLWDPNQNITDLTEDFYNRAFGPAAQAMKHYYETRDIDDASMKISFTDLAEAETLAAGYPEIIERIRYLQLYTRYVWKWHNVGLDNLSLNDLQNLTTFLYRTQALYIVTSRSALNTLRSKLLAQGQTAAQIDALRNSTPPTAAEIKNWMNEGLTAFSADYVPYINPREINLRALGDVSQPTLTIGEYWSQDILIPSGGNEDVEILVTGRGGVVQWYSPNGALTDFIDVPDNSIPDDTWLPLTFRADIPGIYILHTTWSRPRGSSFAVDVPNRPASLLAAPNKDIFQPAEVPPRNAPGWALSDENYFYVPSGTPVFIFGASKWHADSGVWSVWGQLIDPNGELHSFTFNDRPGGEITIVNPVAGLWKLEIFNVTRTENYWLQGIPPLVWHDAKYLLIEAGQAPLPPSGFTLSATDRLHLFRDKTNAFQITGTSFDAAADFRMDFYQGANLVSTFTKRPTDSTKIDLSLTSTQTNTLPIGFYDLKVTKTTDSTTKTYSKQIVVTTLGDIWSSTATDTAEQKRDGKVNLYDVSRMLSKWGSTQAADLALVDINPGPSNVSLNKIDLFDANLLMRNWRP